MSSEDDRFEPDPFQTISDLGQLRAFTHPLQARMLRVLQKYEVSASHLAETVGESAEAIHEHLDALMHAGLVRRIPAEDGQAASYRAGARYYGFRPDPSDLELVAGPLSLALLQAVGQELAMSMSTWPAQRMIGQLRRARLSPARVLEFEDRLEDLVNEFWGSPDQPLAEKDGDPVISFASVVYRYPDEE